MSHGDRFAIWIKLSSSLERAKKTWLNIRESKAFTVALADEAHVDVADYFGIASGNKINDKFERTGYHAVKVIRSMLRLSKNFLL